MEPNTSQNPAEREFSAFECLKGMFLCMYRVLFNEPVAWVRKNVSLWWKLISTREDLFVADIPDGLQWTAKEIDEFYAIWCLLLESVLLGIVLGVYCGGGYGLAWFLISFICRAYQSAYYKYNQNCRMYTLPGAIINARQILADNWAWIKKIGTDEMKRRAAAKTSQA